MEVILINLGILAVSLAIASVLIARSKTKLGFVLGLLPITILVLWLQFSHISITQQCINDHCVSVNLPSGCAYGINSCAEETGIRAIMFWAVGLVDLVLYSIGLSIAHIIHLRCRKAAAAKSGPAEEIAS